jgi:hypothetical protein
VCDPISVMAGAVEIGGKVTDYLAKSKAAKANKVAALDDMRLQFKDVNSRQVEEQKAAAGQIEAGLKQKNQAQGTALAAAAGANVGGLSVQALLNTIEGDAASYTDSVQENLEMIQRQSARDKRAVLAGTSNRIAQVPNPSIIGAGVRIAGAGADIYGDYLKRQPPKE